MFSGISRVLLGYFKDALLSTDYPLYSFCPQIITDLHRFLNIKDILIITDFFGTEIHGFIFNKDTAQLRIDCVYPRHFVITACFASSRLSLLCNILGNDVEKGLLPNDHEILSRMVEDISYNNAKRYFKFY